MSLRVWLPLTKDLRNQGLDSTVISNGGATYSSNEGKIGGTYKFDGSDDYISLTSTTINNIFKGGSTAFTIAMWIYHADSTRAILFGDFSLSGTIGFNVELNTSHTVRFYWNSNPDWSGSNSSVGINTWSHITVTYDGSALKIYINGTLKDTRNGTLATMNKTSGSFYLGRDNRTGTTALNGKINDFRLYDDCLSPMEVKELSKGLVLHYPLNRGGWGQENLLSRYVTTGQTGPTNTSNSGGRTNYYGDYGIIIPATENADTYFRLFLKEQLVSGQQYTISCKVKGLKNGSYYYFPIFAQSNSSMGQLALTHNGLCSLTFTMNWTGTQTAQTTNISGETVYVCFMDDTNRSIASGQGPITVYDFKIEKGDKVTPWCPATTDPKYNTMGIDKNIEYDISGFQNNGTRNGSFDWDSNKPKYSCSMIFNGSDNSVQTPNLTTMVTDKNYTIACWFYKDSIGSKGYQTIYGGPSGFELEARNASDSNPQLVAWNWGKPIASYTFGVWHHFAFVHTDSDCKIYLDGEYVSTGSSITTPSGNYFIGAWRDTSGQNFEGKISDFRIYATSLSADDIKSLYKNI